MPSYLVDFTISRVESGVQYVFVFRFCFSSMVLFSIKNEPRSFLLSLQYCLGLLKKRFVFISKIFHDFALL